MKQFAMYLHNLDRASFTDTTLSTNFDKPKTVSFLPDSQFPHKKHGFILCLEISQTTQLQTES